MAVWQDYGRQAIRELYPRTKEYVDYYFGPATPGATPTLVKDNTGLPINMTDVQALADYRRLMDPNAAYTPNPIKPTPPTPTPPAPPFPDATSVGYKASMGALVDSTGNITTTAPGQIIELRNMKVGHYIRIEHPNCIVRKCVILSGDFYDIKINPAIVTGTTTIEDNTIDNSAVGTGLGGGTGIQGSRMLVQRNKILRCENGINIDGPSVVITGNYIALQTPANPGDKHVDGIQIDGGISDVNIGGNTIVVGLDSTSAVMIDNLNGACANIIVDGNQLSGGSYSVYSDGTKSGAAMTNIQFTNNVFPVPYGQNGAGTISGQGAASVVWTNNRRDSTIGTVIPKP